jgi:putative membrane protein
MMSWLRTAVALIGFTTWNRSREPTPPIFRTRRNIGGLALISCGVLALISIWQYFWTVRYMWGEPFTPIAGLTTEGKQSPVIAVAILLIFIGLFAFFAVLLRLT